MAKTVILSSARTPVGKLGGGLSTVKPVDLGGIAIAGALERAGVDADQIQHVVMGHVIQAGQGQITARQAQIAAGIPNTVPSETINKVCTSSIRSAATVDLHIRAGEYDVAVAGGMESMSRAPYLLPDARFGYRMGQGTMLDSMVLDGLTNSFTGRQMFDETTEVADAHGWKREDLDRWALRSHENALAAIDAGRLGEEIVPVTVKGRKGDTIVDTDEGPRRGSNLEALGKLPGLVKGGSHTAGNSPGVNDGAGALVLSSDEWAAANGKTVLGEIVAFGQAAGDFPNLLTTPGKASAQALEKAGIKASDVAIWEINEAFASVALNTIKDLGIDEDRVNVNGGAIALGHPLGASGARIIGSMLLELRRRGGGYGIATACSGTGQGDAILIKVDA
ncbi:MAG: acetyl-CoA C-acyltransferase [Patulibacter sp.]